MQARELSIRQQAMRLIGAHPSDRDGYWGVAPFQKGKPTLRYRYDPSYFWFRNVYPKTGGRWQPNAGA